MFELVITDFTENATPLKSNLSRNPACSVQIQIKPKFQSQFVPRDTEESGFLDLVDVGDVKFSVEIVINVQPRRDSSIWLIHMWENKKPQITEHKEADQKNQKKSHGSRCPCFIGKPPAPSSQHATRKEKKKRITRGSGYTWCTGSPPAPCTRGRQHRAARQFHWVCTVQSGSWPAAESFFFFVNA